MAKSVQLFRGNYVPPVLIRKNIYTKSGLLPYFTMPSSWMRTSHKVRIFELEGTLDEDDDSYDDNNYREQLLRLCSHMELSVYIISVAYHTTTNGGAMVLSCMKRHCEAQNGWCDLPKGLSL